MILRNAGSRSFADAFSCGDDLQDRRHDAREKFVVERNSAVAELLRKHAMLELRARFVAGDIAREQLHRRVRRLVVEQREERDLQRRIAQPARRRPGSPDR